MSQPVGPTDSRIVMAEQSSHDVVNQTLSGGEPSPSDVPASTNDKTTAGGDVGEIKDTATATATRSEPKPHEPQKIDSSEPPSQRNEPGKDATHPSTDTSKQGPGPVETRALEMNGLASGSEAGEDTASLGGSESDASRTESRAHSRSTSTKRPASFKPVSFAKFSVPKAPGTSPTMKPAEKAPSSSSGTPLGTPVQSSRPRLVAKTTSSLRDSLAKSGPGARPGGGPDPSQVWNKNRPVQQTPPKHLTDEELKQQYGIHMTSRIQEDGGGTEAKWADIDDDEDDWAPETIEWTDGTKTNLTQMEPPSITSQDVKPPEPKDDVLPPRVEPTSAPKEPTTFAPKPTTSIGPNPTVLRLGANAERQARSANPAVMNPFQRQGKVPGAQSRASVLHLCCKGQPMANKRALQNLPRHFRLTGRVGMMVDTGHVAELRPTSFETRRGSQTNGMLEPPMLGRDQGQPKDTPVREPSPGRRGSGASWSHRGAANVSDKAPAAPVEQPGTAQAPQEDPVAMQERIMKEKRMEARQRRLEQEEREEAAKRERIRQKLEALGPPPEKAKPKRKESLDASTHESTASSNTAHPSQSPPKPPVPEPSGEPKQYGMMKVHHPDTVKKLVERERAADRSTTSMGHPRRGHSPVRESKPDTTPVANGLSQHGEPQATNTEKFTEPKMGEQSPQLRGPNLNVSGPYPTWSSNSKLGASPAISNPWKPLNIDKALGNGIFEQGLGGFQSRDISLRNLGLDQPSVAPGPQPFSAPPLSPQENASISPLPSPETRHAAYDALNPISRPAPIGPPSSQPSHWRHDNRVAGPAAWHNFHAVAAKREAEENEKLRNDMNALREGPASLQVNFNETWRQVRTGEQVGQRQIVGTSRSTDSSGPMANPLPGFDHPVGSLPFENSTRPLGSVPVRSSRFFPQATELPRKPAVEEGEIPRSPSPPPPEEMSSHPVYTGSSNRPLVHLPAPKPVVKLPPKTITPPQPPPTFASMAAAPPRVAPVSTATSWQEKINTLFGKKTVPPQKKNALAVLSASKEPLDVQLHIAAVSVSFPQYDELPIGDGEVSAKQVEEAEEIFEDREAGSLPVVQVPISAPPAAWTAARPPSQARRAKSLKPMQVHSVEPYTVGLSDKDNSGNLRVSVRFPGAIIAKTLMLPKKTGGHPRQRGSSSYNNKPRKNAKSRDGPGGPNSKKPASSPQVNGNSSPRQQSRNGSWGPRTFSGSR
ncbi:hypothetical protein ATEIFO6365_0008047900 [Aspergillus terreus]|uniref:Uncharacterized protein n=1 Tax=Aspergillus terreus TaxID=33178 RepID=A0A5M3Z6P6_ASPTE|nr:hypothetical protein ATETN484_0010048800 [Aspergillus terreus]GFF18535.1 hypothetical protein ATEIFO6365_0008047900 [Aspergillus terreus]